VLATFVYHTWSWFNIMPKTMPALFAGGKRVPPAVITGAGLRRPSSCASRCSAIVWGISSMKRSNEPIFWSLFGAGGMLAALIGPALVFITGIAVPLGLLLPADHDELQPHARVHAPLDRQALRACRDRAAAVARRHRIAILLHDFGVTRSPSSRVLLRVALAGTVAWCCSRRSPDRGRVIASESDAALLQALARATLRSRATR
jgi:fumarate reductase subunit D